MKNPHQLPNISRQLFDANQEVIRLKMELKEAECRAKELQSRLEACFGDPASEPAIGSVN